MVKRFLLFDDTHPDFFVGQFERDETEIKPELNALGIGDILPTSESRGILRKS